MRAKYLLVCIPKSNRGVNISTEMLEALKKKDVIICVKKKKKVYSKLKDI